MEVKGTAVVTIEQFITAREGQLGVDEWFDALPQASKDILRERILPSNWYPVQQALVDPTLMACKLFFGGDPKGAWELGRYSAEQGLRGPYKVFLKIATPDVLVTKAIPIANSYYRPMDINLVKVGSNDFNVNMVGIDPPGPVIASRIGGWVERALQLGGTESARVEVTHYGATADDITTIQARWT